jgi:hypothetical protein
MRKLCGPTVCGPTANVSAAWFLKEALHGVAAMLLVLHIHNLCFLRSLALTPRARALPHPCDYTLPVSLPRSYTARTLLSHAGRRAGTFLPQPGLTRIWVYPRRGLVCGGNACECARACVCACGTCCHELATDDIGTYSPLPRPDSLLPLHIRRYSWREQVLGVDCV